MRLRRPSLWLILPAMYSTWFVHVKSDDIKIPRYLKLLTLFTLWSKIDTVRAILLSNFLLLPTSIHLVFSRFKVRSYIARLIFCIFIPLSHLNPPVGRHCDIAQPYRLLASRYMINILGWFTWIIVRPIFVAGSSISISDIWDATTHTFLDKLNHVNVFHEFQLYICHL